MAEGALAGPRRLAERLGRSHPVRTWQRYIRSRGNVLAGGIAYAALFSVFSALLIGFTVFALVLGRRSELRDPVLAAVDEQLPGLLDYGPDGGLVPPEALFAQDLLSTTGVVAAVVALWSGLIWLDAARQGIRQMLQRPFDDRSLLRKKVGDLGILATLGLAILASALLSVGVNATAESILAAVGLRGGPLQQLVLQALSVLVVLVVDILIFVVLFRLLSQVRLTWAEVRTGALVGAIGFGLLKLFGGLLLGAIGGNNPLLATSAILVGLLLWMNLVSRVMLLAAAWVATDRRVERMTGPGPGTEQETTHEERHRSSAPRTPTALPPSYGQRSQDRVTLAAGAVLGLLAASSARVLTGAVRSVVGLPARDVEPTRDEERA